MHELSVVVLVRGCHDLTRQLLDSIARTTALPYRVYVIDNSDETDRFSTANASVDVYRGPGNIYASWNTGAQCSTGNYLVFINNDVLLGQSCLDLLVLALTDITEPGATYPRPVVTLKDLPTKPCCNAVLCGPPEFRGWCFALKRKTYDNVGPFDEDYQWYYGDDDYWRRLVAVGRPAREVLNARAYHIQEATTKQRKAQGEDFKARIAEDRARFVQKWSV